MRACLYSGNADLTKFGEMFPGLKPGEMPVAGKPICRHMVDLCGLLKVSEVLLADRYLNPELAEALGDGSYWSLRLTYLNCKRCASLKELLGLRKDFPGRDGEVLIFWGLVLPDIQKDDELFRELKETDPEKEEPEAGIYLFRDGRFYQCACPVFRCYSLKEYFTINFRFLYNPGVYSLPSYSQQRGFGIGRNVSLLPRCDVQTPVLILDDVFISRGVTMKNGVIIGSDVAIDEKTEISHSIVLDNTYIGRDMVIQDKIVYGRRVLDPQSDTYVDLDDRFLAADFSPNMSGYLFLFLEHLFALFLAVSELPLYLCALFGGKALGGLPFFRFLRNIYPKFWQAAFGHVQLVRFGSRSDYVFRSSDRWYPAKKSKYEKNMADVYYYHNRNVFRMMSVALVSQMKRLLTLREPDSLPGGKNPIS